MTVERYGSKTDVVVKLILVFCVSLLSFAIGTLVGKKFSDNQHKISQLEPNSGDKVAAHKSDNVAPVSDAAVEEPVSDQEISKLAQEFATDDEKPTRTISSEDEGTKKDPAESADKTETKKDGPKITVKPAAKAEETTAATKKAAPAAQTSLSKEVAVSAAGKFTVQVASYPKEEEAEGMAAELKNKGFSAFYVSAKIKGQTWYRVSVGLFSTQKEAQAYRADLLARAKVSTAIVQKISQ